MHNKKVKLMMKVWVERVISFLPGQRASRMLTAEPWVTAVGTWPTATLFLRQGCNCPPHASPQSRRKGAEEKAGRAEATASSSQPAADTAGTRLPVLTVSATEVTRGRTPGWPDGANARSWDFEEDKLWCPHADSAFHSASVLLQISIS